MTDRPFRHFGILSAILEAAETEEFALGPFVRKAASRAVVDEFGRGDALMPELAKLIKWTFRDVHLLAWINREELERAGG